MYAESDPWNPSPWQPIPKYSDEDVAKPRAPQTFRAVAQTHAYLDSLEYGQARLLPCHVRVFHGCISNQEEDFDGCCSQHIC
jgi:hypothetical protein